MSLLNSCPGTRIGKPGGYGVTKIADTTGRPALSRRLASLGPTNSHSSSRYAM
ncbi:hypothetical protein ACIRYZ_12855 [Kitasatospora sp. NPDC101155]|uniref:hypothetical protein n=1 Tax=Kitasatospora sp. NPDC101155 TaxID=3364097 RepID=UPI0037FE11E4